MDNLAYNTQPNSLNASRKKPEVAETLFNGDIQKTPPNNFEIKKEIISVIGSGDYGRAISGKLVKSGYIVYIGSRDPNRAAAIQELVRATGAILVSQDVAANASDTIIVAVGRDHYDLLPMHLLKSKILIDVSNNTEVRKGPHYRSNAEYLQQLVPAAKVVKGFNVLSAYSLESGGLQGSKEVYIASDYTDAKVVVASIIRSMGFIPVDWGVLSAARDIEDVPLKLMPSWQRPTAVVFGLFVFLWLLALLKTQICQNFSTGRWNENWKHITMINLNRVLGVLALWVLSFCYLPGLLAAYLQLWRGTKYSRFPDWLDKWLRMRKQLGLLMLGVASVHGCMSLGSLFPQTNRWVFEKPTVINVQTLVENITETQELKIYSYQYSWTGGLFLTFGALALCLTIVLGITSLPSVTASLTWREFTFIQSKLGWVLLVIGSLHNIFLAWQFMFRYYQCFNIIPVGPEYAMYPPFICGILKIPLLFPPVDRYLMSIRKGYDRRRFTTKGGNIADSA